MIIINHDPWRPTYKAIKLKMIEQALMSLFVLASKDGWVNIMYTGLDAVGVDKQVKAFVPEIISLHLFC